MSTASTARADAPTWEDACRGADGRIDADLAAQWWGELLAGYAAGEERMQRRDRALITVAAALAEDRAVDMLDAMAPASTILTRAWRLAELAPDDRPRLRAVTAAELLALDLQPREMVLDPVIPAQGLAMLYAPRGAGKTYLALAMAHAIAAGAPLLSWRVPRSRRVLYLDGEMPAVTMRERLARIIRGSEADAAPDALRLATPDLQAGPMPDLGTPGGRAAVEALLDGVDVVIIDSVSTLAAAGDENDATAWLPLQRWALDLRRSGRSVLLIHHAGKTGAQRGTSRREDVLDTVLALRRPSGYRPEEGARVEIIVEKGRGIHGDDARTIEASLVDDGSGGLRWSYMTRDDAVTERVAAMIGEGVSHRDIARDLGIGVATVSRHRRAAEAAGLLSREVES